MIILLEFDIEYVEHKEIKGQAIVDQLANLPIQDDAPIQVDFPDEHLIYMTKRTWKRNSNILHYLYSCFI